MSLRRSALASLWIFAVAFGCIEGATVVYLMATAPKAVRSASGLFPLSALSPRLITIELVREACTLILLAAVAWSAGHRWRDRIGAFLLTFGLWDLVYYGALRVMLGWPESFRTWDVLFLIPAPWVAPVWVPSIVAAIFIVAGTHLFWTSEDEHKYLLHDFVLLTASAAAIVIACLISSNAALTVEQPTHFPLWLYWAGVVVGVGGFWVAERRRPATLRR